MIASKSFTIPTEGKLLAVIISVLTFGTLALVLLALGAVVAAASIINLTLGVLVDLSIHIAMLYSRSDPALRLFMLCIAGYLLIKVFPLVKHSLAASYAKN